MLRQAGVTFPADCRLPRILQQLQTTLKIPSLAEETLRTQYAVHAIAEVWEIAFPNILPIFWQYGVGEVAGINQVRGQRHEL